MNKSLLFFGLAAALLFISGRALFFASGAQTEDETVYIARRADNICGLNDPRKLSRPAVVAYSVLLNATPQVKRIKREKIDPDSAQGVVLMTRARALVLEKCVGVIRKHGYCSVWKAIRRRDGKPIPDITALVKKKILEDVQGQPAEGSPHVGLPP